ncbi:MAG: preprotein translocase subunit SecG [Pirellulales bacterium]
MTALIRFGLGFLLVFSSFFLIALVLIQRGRGGGLAGAFGGAGGQSAFGTKAGDVFTRITVVVAACWILLCILAINVLGQRQSLFSPTLGGTAGQQVPSTIPATGQPDGPAAPAESTPAQPAEPAAEPASAPEARKADAAAASAPVPATAEPAK